MAAKKRAIFRKIFCLFLCLVLLLSFSSCMIVRKIRGAAAAEEQKPAVIPVIDYTPTDGEDDLAEKTAPVYEGQTPLLRKAVDEETYFWFSTLGSEAERAAYRSFARAAAAFADTAYFTEDILQDDVSRVFRLFLLDHPEVFFYESKYGITGSKWSGNVSECTFRLTAERETLIRRRGEIDGVARYVLSLIPEDATDVEAEMIIARWLTRHLTYDADAKDAGSLYGALIGRRCVCEGYAEAFQYICNLAGIPCFSVTGSAFNGSKEEKHKWNAVQIGGEWYLCDMTFAKSSEAQFARCFNTNVVDNTDYTPEEELSDDLPPFNAVKAGYFNLFGMNFTRGSEKEDFLRVIGHYVDRMDRGADRTEVLIPFDSADSAEYYRKRLEGGDGFLLKSYLRSYGEQNEDRIVGVSAVSLKGRLMSFVIALGFD